MHLLNSIKHCIELKITTSHVRSKVGLLNVSLIDCQQMDLGCGVGQLGCCETRN